MTTGVADNGTPVAEVSPNEVPEFSQAAAKLTRGRNRGAERGFRRYLDRAPAEACLSVAALFAAEGDHTRALRVLDRLLGADPAHAKALALRIDYLAAASRPYSAYAAARDAARRRPDDARFHLLQARCAEALGLRTDALAAAERGLELAPDDQDLRQRKLVNLLDLRRIDAAARVTSAQPSHELAEIYDSYLYPAQALAILGEAEDVASVRARTKILSSEGRRTEAVKEARAAADRDPADPDLRLVLIDVLTWCDMDEEALSEAHRILTVHPENEEALSARDAALQKLGRTTAPPADGWDRFVSPASPSPPPEIRAGDGRIRRLLSRWSDRWSGSPARRSAGLWRAHTPIFQLVAAWCVLRADPDNADAREVQVSALLRLRLRRRALRAAYLASHPGLLLDVADAFTSRNEAAAIRVLARMPRFVPEPPDLTKRRVQVLGRLTRHGEAERVVSALVAESPGDPEALLTAASAVSGWDNDDLAARYAREAVALDPSYPAAHRALIRYLIWAHRPDEALEASRAAIMAAPESVDLWGQLLQSVPDAEAAEVIEDALSAFPAERHVEVLTAMSGELTSDVRAYECLTRALALDAGDHEAIIAMARLLGSLGAYVEARRLLSDRTSVHAYEEIADLLVRMDLRELARELRDPAPSWHPLAPVRRARRAIEADVLLSFGYGVEEASHALDGMTGFAHTVARGLVEPHVLALAWQVALTERAETFVRRGAAILGAVAAWLAIRSGTPAMWPWSWPGDAVALVTIVVVAGFAAHIPIRRLTNRIARGVMYTGAVESVAVLAPAALLLYSTLGPATSLLGLSLLAAEVILLARAGAVLALRLGRNLLMSRTRRRNPRAEILAQLLYALNTMRAGHGYEERWRCAGGIDMAAIKLESALARTLPTGDPITAEWQARVTREAAYALRVLKRRLLSGQGSAEHVRTELGAAAVAVASGEYGRLRRMPPPPKPGRRGWRDYVLPVSRAVVVMGLPVLVVVALHPFMGLTGDAYRTALWVTIAWAALYLLLALDPALREKIETARSILSTSGAPPKLDPKSQAGEHKTD